MTYNLVSLAMRIQAQGKIEREREERRGEKGGGGGGGGRGGERKDSPA